MNKHQIIEELRKQGYARIADMLDAELDRAAAIEADLERVRDDERALGIRPAKKDDTPQALKNWAAGLSEKKAK